jgi:hypothetical protein
VSFALAALIGLLSAPDYERRGECHIDVAAMSPDQFVACARAGTERYRDHAAAVLDGYRAIGRDFPGMGEHWIRVSLVFDGAFDPARPEILNYIVVNGTRRLLGVAYAVPLLEGETPPSSPAGPEAWHDHSRTIEDETVLPHHHTRGSTASLARLSMLHAWLWSPNPDGMFAADNWAIPFLRLNLAPGAEVRTAAAKALALASGGRDYFEMAIDAAARLSPEESHRVRAGMAKAEAAVRQLIPLGKGTTLDEMEHAELNTIWRQLWEKIDAAISDTAREKLGHSPIR